MKQKFAKFMYGRYGTDELSRALSFFALALLIVSMFLGLDARSSCRAVMRVPKGKGKVRIICKKCGTAFEKKT